MAQERIDDARRYVDQFANDGGTLVRFCSDILFNLASPAEEQRDGLLEFYRRAVELIGHSVRHVKNGEGTRWRPVPKNLPELLAAWYDNPPKKSSYVLALECSAEADRVSDAAFELSWVLGSGYVRLVLPAEALVEDPERFRRTALELASLVDYSSGTAGYSANIHLDHNSTDDDSAIGSIGQRYPGIDLGKPLYWSDLVSEGLKTVNWLTFLGPEFLAKAADGVNDRGAFAARFGPDIDVVPAGRGQMIQAGPVARLGDGPKADLAPYRRVAQVLHGLKIPPEVLRGYDGIGGTDNTRRWLDRLDQ